MPKTKSEIIFDALVSKTVWPYFKMRGYKKAGNNIRYYDQSGWGKMLNFQKSMYYNKDNLHFTINTGLYLSEGEQFHSDRQSFEKFQESMCMVRQRVGYLCGEKKDLWFDINDNTNKEELAKTIEGYIIKCIIPYLDTVRSKQDIINFFLRGHRSEYIAAQIEILFANGYKDIGNELLQKEIKKTSSSFFLDTLNKIAKKYID